MYFSRTLALALALAASASAQDQTIYEIGAASDDFKTVVAAVDAAGLKDALNDAGSELTLFAPNDAAFAKLPEGLVTKLLKPDWKPQLVDLLKYHVVAGKVMAADVTDGLTAPALNEEELSFAVGESGVVVSKGDGTVILADIAASNGVIHAVDAVLTPTSVTSSVVDIAVADADTFSTLVAAVTAADLAATLSGPGPFTVLAPTNDAFAALPEGTLDTLLKSENKDQLASILKLHVISGNVPASAVTTGTVPALGGDLAAKVEGDTVTFNDAKVIKADVLASNGIIHVIDKVITAPTDDSGESPATTAATTAATEAPAGATTVAATEAPAATTAAPEDDSAASRMTFLSALAFAVGAALLL